MLERNALCSQNGELRGCAAGYTSSQCAMWRACLVNTITTPRPIVDSAHLSGLNGLYFVAPWVSARSSDAILRDGVDKKARPTKNCFSVGLLLSVAVLPEYLDYKRSSLTVK